jgi:FdhE protein
MNRLASSDLKSLFEDTVPVILPVPARLFEKRSARLRFMAPGHSIAAYLEAMARLAEAQFSAAQAPPQESLGTSRPELPFNVLDGCYREGWQKALEVIVAEMQYVPLPEPSQAALSRLREAPPAALESLAQSLLGGNLEGIDRAASHFLAAALQVYWANQASKAQVEMAERRIQACPVCASPPVAGVVMSGRKLCYLCCSLCATHWYVPRITCTNCGSTEGITYFAVDGDAAGTKAEACSKCGTYLKLFYLENNPEAEAFADDLATLALDILMTDHGYGRLGLNLFLLPE